MSRPTAIYPWDSNGTHLVTPTAGHQTDGFVTGEVVGSGEINALLQNMTQELAYLDSVVHLVGTVPVSMDGWSVYASPSGGSAIPGMSGGKRYLTSLTQSGAGNTTRAWRQIPLSVGVTITDITFTFDQLAGGSLEFGVASTAEDGTYTERLVAWNANGTGAGAAQITMSVSKTFGALPIVIGQSTALSLYLLNTSTSTTHQSDLFGVTLHVSI